MRSLTGFGLLALTLGLLAYSTVLFVNAWVEEGVARRGGPPAEREYAVNIAQLAPEAVSPVLKAYGTVQSATSLELRTATGGTILALSPRFRDGGRVDKGEVLFRIDPAEFEAKLALAESDLDASRAEEVEAEVGLELAREERAAAERQRDLRLQAKERAQGLRKRGVNTEADVEAAELAASSAEQAYTGRRLAFAQAEARIKRASIATQRARIARDEAARDLENTVQIAPFDGILTEVTGVAGGLVSPNEKLARLLDPHTLEVAFRVSPAAFDRLTSDDGKILDLSITARLPRGDTMLTIPGRIDRAGASLQTGETGRLVFALLDLQGNEQVWPGDFAIVEVAEPRLSGIARVPSTALAGGTTLLLLQDDNRLEEQPVQVVLQQGDETFLDQVPFGRLYVVQRLPQLGTGIKVRPVGGEQEPAQQSQDVTLTPERRARLVAQVQQNRRMPKDVKARILAQLDGETVPRRVVERLEARGSGG